MEQTTLSKSNIIGQKQLHKLKQVPLPPLLDLSLTRVYFSSGRDGFGRIAILIVHLLWISLIFFNGIAIGKFVANSSVTLAFPLVQRIILQVVAMLVTIIFAFIILLMILPIFLAKTIRGISLICVIYLVLGTIVNLAIMVSSFWIFFDTDSPDRTTILWLTIVGVIFWWITIINWWSSALKKKKQLIKSIINIYGLTVK